MNAVNPDRYNSYRLSEKQFSLNFVQILATLRKLGNYLAGLFPALVVVAEWFANKLKKLCAHPKVAPLIERVASKPWVVALWTVIERFYWRNYAKDRLNLSESPAETLALLRPVLQLCVLLCLLIPLTQFDFWMVPLETMSGFKSHIPSWSVMLFCVALPFAWSAVLAGTSVSNRPAFAAAALSCLYFMATCAFLPSRSYWNGFLAVTVLTALVFCERSLKKGGRSDSFFGMLCCLITGIACGVQLIAMTPLREIVAGASAIVPGTPISLVVGPPLGAVLGLVAFTAARAPATSATQDAASSQGLLKTIPTGSFPATKAPVWTLLALLLIYTIAALCRGGFSIEAGLLLSSVSLSNAYLWPAWYFIGVGIVLKLMGHSRTVANAIDTSFNPRALSPVLITVLIILTVCAFSERVITLLQYSDNQLLRFAYQFFLFFWRSTTSFIWNVPLNAMLANWMSWVLLLNVLLVVVLTFTRNITNEIVTRLAYLTCLAGLLIWEYLFQLSSFARSPSHSVTAVFLFSAWLLWLMHTVGWDISSKSSPRWPSQGRFAIYCGITLFILLEIFGRTAARDWRVSNEIFLSMFRGVIDFGLPYFLYLYTRIKLPNFPLKTSAIFGAYIAGSAASLAFNGLDKMSVSNWDATQLKALIQLQIDQLTNVGSIDLDIGLAPTWLFVRSLLFIACLICVGNIFRTRSGAFDERTSSAVLIIAFASGVASFTSTLVDLPIPRELKVLTAPLLQELTFNENVFRTFLGHWLPALLLAATLLSSRWRDLSSIISAAFLSMLIAFACLGLYEQYGVWLRATGMLTIAILMGVTVLFAFLAFIIHKLECAAQASDSLTPAHAEQEQDGEVGRTNEVAQEISQEVPQEISQKVPHEMSQEVAQELSGETDVNSSKNKPILVPYPVLCAILCATMLTLLSAAVYSATGLPLRELTLTSLNKTASVPARWKEQDNSSNLPNSSASTTNQTNSFAAREDDGSSSQITVLKVPSMSSGTRALLKQLFEEFANNGGLRLTPISIAPWGRLTGRSGATACFFSFERPSASGPIPHCGVTVVVPEKNGQAEVYTLFTNPTDIEREQWQLALIVQSARSMPIRKGSTRHYHALRALNGE